MRGQNNKPHLIRLHASMATVKADGMVFFVAKAWPPVSQPPDMSRPSGPAVASWVKELFTQPTWFVTDCGKAPTLFAL